MPVPGVVTLPDGRRLTAEWCENGANDPLAYAADAHREIVDVDVLEGGETLTVRSKRKGDRFVPLGAGGSTKLKDLFIDAKVPREDRERAVIVLSGVQIIWVAPHRISDALNKRATCMRIPVGNGSSLSLREYAWSLSS